MTTTTTTTTTNTLMAALLFTLAGCSILSGEGGDDEPTREELIAACEATVECSLGECASEHADLITWQDEKPSYKSACPGECYDICEVADSDCSTSCFSTCEDCINSPTTCDGNACMAECKQQWREECEPTCETRRQDEFDAWSDHRDTLAGDLEACEDGCIHPFDRDDFDANVICNTQDSTGWIACAVMTGLSVAQRQAEEKEASCQERLKARFSWY